MEKTPVPLESPEREWFIDDRLRRLDHLAHVDTSHPLPFKTKKGVTDAIFPDELAKLQLTVGGILFTDCDEQGEGLRAGRVLLGEERYGGDLNGQG